MNSSDSEEDFESADEDVAFDNPQESQDGKEDINKVVFYKDTIENNTLVASSEEIKVDFKEEPVDFGCNPILKTDATPDEAIKSIEVKSPKIKEAKIKPTVKKLGTKLTNETANVQHEEGDSHAKPEDQNVKSIERKMNSMKLGMKLTPEEIKDKVKDSDNEALFNISKNVKTEKKLENDKSISISNEHVTLENIEENPLQNTLKPEETSFEGGDGWDIEEEDGFEIPVTLAKIGDGGIQCPQEQISELGQVEFKPSRVEQEQGWGGWGGWGVSSLLSTATGTVTTFSSHVTAGLSTVLETTVGAPDPETLAGEHWEIKEEPTKTEDQMGPGYGGLGSIMSGVSFLGSSVINRGLDTLETIGKKTMEVLQEGDPGLKKKRAMLFQNEDKPILSQILREAKEKADNSDKEKEEKEAARKVHFESLFDDFQGMVHLEALEMLSTQCELKLQSLLQSHSGSQLLDLQETLSQVRDLCEVAEEEEDAEVLTAEQFAEKVTNCVEGLRIKITPVIVKIIKVNSEICERLEQMCGTQSATLVNQTAISSLAELTAAAMECFHKSAELVMAKPVHNTADEAENYVQLTSHLCARVSAVAGEFTQLLTKNDPIANSSLITNIFLEASNSCSYIKNACQLLVPILQVGAVAS